MTNTSSIKSLSEVIEYIMAVKDRQEFQKKISYLQKCRKIFGITQQESMELGKRAYYPQNEYSAKAEKENMELAKERVISYLAEIMNDSAEDEELLNILENFYLFWESLTEREPHKSGGIQKEQLETLKIKNEYDVQHLPKFAVKPLALAMGI